MGMDGRDTRTWPKPSYVRYVALGDSQTEGLNDGDELIGYCGWADRLAERLAQLNPALLYANLAVRGKRTTQIHDEQLPRRWRCGPISLPYSPG